METKNLKTKLEIHNLKKQKPEHKSNKGQNQNQDIKVEEE